MEGTPEPLPGWEVLPRDVSFRLMHMQFSVLHSRNPKPSPMPGTPLLPQSFALLLFLQHSNDALGGALPGQSVAFSLWHCVVCLLVYGRNRLKNRRIRLAAFGGECRAEGGLWGEVLQWDFLIFGTGFRGTTGCSSLGAPFRHINSFSLLLIPHCPLLL